MWMYPLNARAGLRAGPFFVPFYFASGAFSALPAPNPPIACITTVPSFHALHHYHRFVSACPGLLLPFHHSIVACTTTIPSFLVLQPFHRSTFDTVPTIPSFHASHHSYHSTITTVPSFSLFLFMCQCNPFSLFINTINSPVAVGAFDFWNRVF